MSFREEQRKRESRTNCSRRLNKV